MPLCLHAFLDRSIQERSNLPKDPPENIHTRIAKVI